MSVIVHLRRNKKKLLGIDSKDQYLRAEVFSQFFYQLLIVSNKISSSRKAGLLIACALSSLALSCWQANEFKHIHHIQMY